MSHQLTERLSASVTGLFYYCRWRESRAVSTVFLRTGSLCDTETQLATLNGGQPTTYTYTKTRSSEPIIDRCSGIPATIMFTYYPKVYGRTMEEQVRNLEGNHETKATVGIQDIISMVKRRCAHHHDHSHFIPAPPSHLPFPAVYRSTATISD